MGETRLKGEEKRATLFRDPLEGWGHNAASNLLLMVTGLNELDTLRAQ
jgi:hypothetical protein